MSVFRAIYRGLHTGKSCFNLCNVSQARALPISNPSWMFSGRNYCEGSSYGEKSVNQVNLLGRVGIDPQLRGTDANPVVIFTLATHSQYRYETGEIQQKTQWHRVSVFKPYLRNTVYQYMKKGSRVFVQGKLTYGEITDVKGVNHITTTIVADDVIFLGHKNDKEVTEDISS